MDEKVKYWIDLSDYDFETAKAMLKSKRLLYVGFMCHQAIEKILKAYFVFSKESQPKFTHRLTYLTESTDLEKILSEEQKYFIDELEPLNIEARYPTHKDLLFKELNADKCHTILKQTEELILWIKKKL
ncbi:MAG: HEPN domain-containing protein [Candidatus Cloacimonadales bacterium]|nr:HEPN domain-containing protein [Candidatus Cloacimonadales bacterium]